MDLRANEPKGSAQTEGGALELLQLVGFHVGGEEFVIDILRVQEIIRTQQLTRVPNCIRQIAWKV